MTIIHFGSFFDTPVGVQIFSCVSDIVFWTFELLMCMYIYRDYV